MAKSRMAQIQEIAKKHQNGEIGYEEAREVMRRLAIDLCKQEAKLSEQLETLSSQVHSRITVYLGDLESSKELDDPIHAFDKVMTRLNKLGETVQAMKALAQP